MNCAQYWCCSQHCLFIDGARLIYPASPPTITKQLACWTRLFLKGVPKEVPRGRTLASYLRIDLTFPTHLLQRLLGAMLARVSSGLLYDAFAGARLGPLLARRQNGPSFQHHAASGGGGHAHTHWAATVAFELHDTWKVGGEPG